MNTPITAAAKAASQEASAVFFKIEEIFASQRQMEVNKQLKDIKEKKISVEDAIADGQNALHVLMTLLIQGFNFEFKDKPVRLQIDAVVIGQHQQKLAEEIKAGV